MIMTFLRSAYILRPAVYKTEAYPLLVFHITACMIIFTISVVQR